MVVVFFLDFEVFTLYYYVLVFSTWLNTLFIVLDKKNGKIKKEDSYQVTLEKQMVGSSFWKASVI